jgi:sigma-B regulation protein RsbU (phosphoserine phosphatase)
VLLRFLIAFASLGVGLLALRRSDTSVVKQVFALYSFAVAAMASLHYFLLPGSYATFTLPYQVNVYRFWFAFGSLYGGFWLHLQYIYPRSLDWVRRNPVLAYALCYLASVLLLLLWLNSAATTPLVPVLALPERATLASVVIAAVPVLISLGILLYRYRRSLRLEARQLRLLLWAVAVGIVLQNVSALISHILPVWCNAQLYRNLVLITVTFAALMLGPLAFAYAFRKYRLMDVEAKLRRATRFALVTGVLVGILVALAYGFSQIVLARFGGSSHLSSAVIAFALAFAIPPMQRRVSRFLERQFYPERARLRQLLHQFLVQASTFPDKQSFYVQLKARLQDGLNVEGVQPMLRKDGGFWFTSDSPLLQYLYRFRRPLPLDEASASGRVPLRDTEAEWLRTNHIGLLLPLVLHGRLTGFLAIGLRTDGEDYDAEELQILNSLAPQIAVAIENLNLLEENIEKKRLEKELGLARRTQENLLPRRLPQIRDLEIAATCHFCLEVAGDYYDVIPLAGGRTALAVADVSGKGAAAALLMASVQAALHTAVGAGGALPEVVAGINRLIWRNSSPEQFVTFFVSVFDPATSSMTYVNAGHNAPILVRNDQTWDRLDVGGIILGCLPEAAYEQGVIGLAPGDTLLMYTDGVTEARNRDDQMFEESRLLEILSHQFRDHPRAILDSIEQAVTAFHSDTSFEDDFTLLVIRRS